MTVLTEDDAPFLAGFEAFDRARAGHEPEAVGEIRRRAIERFAELGFPSVRQEDWRFTNVAPIAKREFHRADGSGEATAEALAPWLFESAGTELVFVDGRLSHRALGPRGPAGGDDADRPEPRAGRAPGAGRASTWPATPTSGEHAFAALNTAYMAEGAFLHLPRGAVVEQPIHVLHYSTGETDCRGPRADGVPAQPGGRSPRRARRRWWRPTPAPRARSTSTARSPRSCAAGRRPRPLQDAAGVDRRLPHGDLPAPPGAGVELRPALALARRRAWCETTSTPSSPARAASRSSTASTWSGASSSSTTTCGSSTPRRTATASSSSRGSSTERSRAVFNGLIHVHRGAQKTDAKQSSQNLLLSGEALVNSNPQLLIFADDVKCTHGSTVGQLDDDAVFYLRSRGIGQEAARSLLVYAFASDIVGRIKVAGAAPGPGGVPVHPPAQGRGGPRRRCEAARRPGSRHEQSRNRPRAPRRRFDVERGPGASSRASTRRSTATRWSTSTTPPPPRSPGR